jgi:hypothetical protein
VTSLALIQKVLRVKTDVRVVTVDIVQPYLVVHYQPRLHATDLTDATVNSHPLLNESISRSLPCLGFIELFLSQHLSGSSVV